MYNTTNITDANSMLEVYTATDQLAGGWISVFLLFTVFLVLLIAFRNEQFSIRIIGSAFVTSVISASMFFLGLIETHILLYPILILFIAIGVHLFSKN